jgi:hypothetical protein
MDKKLIFGHFRYFHTEVTNLAGRQDLTVSANLAGCRVSKNRKF